MNALGTHLLILTGNDYDPNFADGETEAKSC